MSTAAIPEEGIEAVSVEYALWMIGVRAKAVVGADKNLPLTIPWWRRWKECHGMAPAHCLKLERSPLSLGLEMSLSGWPHPRTKLSSIITTSWPTIRWCLCRKRRYRVGDYTVWSSSWACSSSC